MKSSKFNAQITKRASNLGMCLLLAASPLVSTRLDAQDTTLPRSGLADPTQATKQMRHLVPANVKEIREICPDVSCEFILQQIEAGATIYEVRDAYHRLLSARLKRLTQENAKLRGGQRTAQNGGVLPVIRLRSKVVIDEKSNVALLEIDKQLVRIHTGQNIQISFRGVTLTIRAEEVSTSTVRLLIEPLNLRMEL